MHCILVHSDLRPIEDRRLTHVVPCIQVLHGALESEQIRFHFETRLNKFMENLFIYLFLLLKSSSLNEYSVTSQLWKAQVVQFHVRIY